MINNMLNIAESNILLCLEFIVENYFFLGRSVMVSFPDKIISYNHKERNLLPDGNHLNYVNIALHLLHQLNENLEWPTQTTETNARTPIMSLDFMSDTDIHHNYIIFMPSLEEDDSDQVAAAAGEVIEDYNQQDSLNIHGRYVIVIVDKGIQSPPETALSVLKAIWKWYPVYDMLVIIPYMQETQVPTLQLYTWLPFEINGQIAILLDEWLIAEKGKLLEGNNLFPSKIPFKFYTKPLRVQPLAYEPVLYYRGNYTDKNNEINHLYEGPEMDILNMIAGHMNLSMKFKSTSNVNITSVNRIHQALILAAMGITTDITIGSLPLHPDTLDWMEFSHPYFITGMTWFVPCPKPYPRLKKIAETFPIEVWLVFFYALILTASVIRCISKCTVRKESTIYNSVAMCFYCMWAVILGVSVPQMPNTSIIRTLFLLFVWYAFAMNTLFQTFFTSYLVDPGNLDQIRTISELLNSTIPMGYYKLSAQYLFTDETDTIVKQITDRGVSCPDTEYKSCLLKVLIGQNYSTLRSELYSEYFVKTTMPRKIKPLCSLDDRFITFYIVAYFKKRSPYLKTFNKILRRVDEGGLLAKTFKDFQESWRYGLSPDAEKYDDDINDDYFVFSMKYMIIAFYMLAAGCILSSVVLFTECCTNTLRKRIFKAPSNIDH